MLEIQLPSRVTYIIDKLMKHGFEAYAVGGCVRDSILGRNPKDWDITTSATPRQVKGLFERTIDTGIQHGTVTVRVDKESFEVTTYRIDGAYMDSRHPSEVVFTGSLLEDLKRRDFTINAMAYNDEKGLVDAFNGKNDLARGIIRCVGRPEERFKEDALRMLRAVRFGAQLGFVIEDETRAAIRSLAPTLSNISAERIQSELLKLLVSPHPEELRTLYETGITAVILPWFDEMMETPQNNLHHCYNVGEHTIHALKHIAPEKVLRLAMLFHDMAKPCCKRADKKGIYHFPDHPAEGAVMAKFVMRRLKFDNDTIDRVTGLVRWHDESPKAEPAEVRRAVYRIGQRQFPALFYVKRADTLAKSGYLREEKLAYIDALEAEYKEIMEQNQCISLKQLAVTGEDLIKAGMKPGPDLGQALEYLLELVLTDPACNTKEILMEKLIKRA